jgi:hypothetical protein
LNGDRSGRTGINLAGSTVDRDFLAGTQARSGVAGADNAGQLKLAGDDRRMTRHATPIGYQRCRAAHCRHPVRTCHLGDQDFAVEELALLIGGGEDPYPP